MINVILVITMLMQMLTVPLTISAEDEVNNTALTTKTAGMDNAVTDEVNGFKGDFAKVEFSRPLSTGAIHYAAQGGVFGKAADDKSLYMYNDPDELYKATDTAQLIRWGDNLAFSLTGWSAEKPATDMTQYCKAGEYFELSFSMAYDGENSVKQVDTFLVSSKVGNATRQKAALSLLKIDNGELKIWETQVKGVKLQPKKWYNFKFVFKAGTDRTYDVYIDDMLLQNGTVTTRLYRGAKDSSISDLYGLYQVWFSNHVRNSDDPAASADGAKFSKKELYVDDLTYKTYSSKPVYSKLDIQSDNADMNRNINSNAYRGLQILTESSKTVNDLGNLSFGTETVVISSVKGTDGSVKTGTDLITGSYMEFKRADGTKLYTTFTDRQIDAYTNEFGAEVPSDNGVSTTLKSFTGCPDNSSSSVSTSVGGKNSSDYSYIIKTTNTKGYIKDYEYAPRIQTNVNAILDSANGGSAIEPFHYETNVFVNGDCDAPVYFEVRMLSNESSDGSYTPNTGPQSTKYKGVVRYKMLSIWPDGSIKGNGDKDTIYRTHENEWIKIRISVYPMQNTLSVYINGTNVINYYWSGANKNVTPVGTLGEQIDVIDWVRVYQAYPYTEDSNVTFSGSFGFDNMHFYTGSAKEEIRHESIVLGTNDSSMTIDNCGCIIYMNTEGIDVSDFFAAVNLGGDNTGKIFEDAELIKELEVLDEIPDKAILCVESGDVYKYYQLRTGAPRVLEITDIKDANGESIVKGGCVAGNQAWNIEFESYQYNQNMKVYVAEYKGDNFDELIDVQEYIIGINEWENSSTTSNYAYSTCCKESINVEIGSETKGIGIFAWSNDKYLMPLCKCVKFNSTGERAIEIACWGDSLTYGQGVSDTLSTYSLSYPGVLSSLTGETVYNMGVPGETSMTIAARQGVFDIVFDEDFTIPESGEISLPLSGEEGAYYFAASNGAKVVPRDKCQTWNPVTINGVEGSITTSVNSVWPRTLISAKFTRNTPGEAVEVKKGDKLVTAASKIKADINIFFTGTNGGWNTSHTSASDNESDDLATLIEQQIAATKDPSKYIVIGLTDGDKDKWTNTNNKLKSEFAEHFIDAKEYLASEQALTDAGITATSDDIIDLSNGKIPTSLRSDNTHLNDKGYELLANLVYKKLVELNYLLTTDICEVKDNKKAIRTFTSDDSLIASSEYFSEEFERLNLKGSLAMVVDCNDGIMSRLMIDNVENSEVTNRFKKIFETNNFDIINHSYHHTSPNAEVTGDTTYSDYWAYEINGAQTALQNIFTRKVFTVANPLVATNETLDEIIKQNNWAARNGKKNYSDQTLDYNSLNPTEDEWFHLKWQHANTNCTADTMKEWIDTAIENKQWLVELWHGIEEYDPSSSKPVKKAVATEYFEYAAAKDSLIWNATINEAVMYLREKQNADISMGVNGDTIEISLEVKNLPKDIFNYPLTVRTKVPKEWNTVKVVQNGTSHTVVAKERYIIYDVVPNAGVVSLKKID